MNIAANWRSIDRRITRPSKGSSKVNIIETIPGLAKIENLQALIDNNPLKKTVLEFAMTNPAIVVNSLNQNRELTSATKQQIIDLLAQTYEQKSRPDVAKTLRELYKSSQD